MEPKVTDKIRIVSEAGNFTLLLTYPSESKKAKGGEVEKKKFYGSLYQAMNAAMKAAIELESPETFGEIRVAIKRTIQMLGRLEEKVEEKFKIVKVVKGVER